MSYPSGSDHPGDESTAGVPDPAGLPSFALWQRLDLTANRYEVRAGDKNGPMVAFAHQKRMALKESVTFYADASMTRRIVGFRARSVLDFGATYDIVDGADQAIATFRKDARASLLRSTWILEVPHQGLTGRGQERSQAVAVLRRFTDFGWPVHFDFAADDGTDLLTIERGWSLRDAYQCTLPAAPNGARLDWRVAACLAVACDALLGR